MNVFKEVNKSRTLTA